MRLHVLVSGLVLVVTAGIGAQTAPHSDHWEYVAVRSGAHANPFPVEGVVWRDIVAATDGSSWLRLSFAACSLDKGSYLRIVSLADGDIQTMHQEHVEQWSMTSAYFNGNALMIELVAGPHTRDNRVDIDKILVGDQGLAAAEPESICGTTDNRVPSSHGAVGRIYSIGCTGWIIANAAAGSSIDKLHLSAGHCYGTGQVLQFAVPGSNANCSLVHPPASQQFAIDSASSQRVNGGVGNDYWVFKCFPNSTTGLTSFQTRNTSFTLATSIPANGTTLRNYGFGVDGTNSDNATGNSCSCSSSAGTGQRNQTQQTHTGPLNSVSGTRLNYGFDTCGGNSGSVVQHNTTGLVVGIHTHGGCTSGGGSNSGTSITHSGLQSAIAAMSSGATLPNNECSGAVALQLGNNGPYSTASATTSTPSWPCAGGGNDIWFTYAVPCARTVTFSTCVSGSNYDTALQVFSGTCSGLTSLGCNDDWSGCSLSTLRSRVVVTTTGATTLRIRVGGYNGARGTFLLNVSHTACP